MYGSEASFSDGAFAGGGAMMVFESLGINEVWRFLVIAAQLATPSFREAGQLRGNRLGSTLCKEALP